MSGFSDIDPVLVHTGQHYDENMSGVFFKELGIHQPNHNLGVGSGTHTWQTAQVMLALEPLLLDLRPDLILVVGDVNSTVAAALVATKLQIRLAHVEAGLRSFDRAMPEEINRVVTDALADLLFTTEPTANENLKNEGISSDKVFFVGNVMIDTLFHYRECASTLAMPSRYGVMRGDYALLTLHRPSNVDVPSTLKGILDAVNSIQSLLPVVFPVHPRTLKHLKEPEVAEQIRAMPNLKIVEPLGYLEFLGLMADSRMVLTDSGGIQEETTILGVPCLTLRENTERPITLTEGTNRLVGTSPERIKCGALDALSNGAKNVRCPELWDGMASRRIMEIIREQLGK